MGNLYLKKKIASIRKQILFQPNWQPNILVQKQWLSR